MRIEPKIQLAAWLMAISLVAFMFSLHQRRQDWTRPEACAACGAPLAGAISWDAPVPPTAERL